MDIQRDREKSQETSGLKNSDDRIVSVIHLTITAQGALVPTVEIRKPHLSAGS